MTHRQAVGLMVLATLLWSIAGVVTRHLDAARTFEVTFFRSAFNALALAVLLSWRSGAGRLVHAIRHGGRMLWLSGAAWSVMFTAFMVALTLTTVANVLVTIALAPLLTALVARAALGYRLPARTWVAIAVAAAGIAWMYGAEVGTAGGRHIAGIAIALCVPVAGAVNWTVIQHGSRRAEGARDLLPAVLIGAMLSAAVTLPAAWPFEATAHDVGLLALLGVAQLAIPCLLAVTAARVLAAPEIALLGLLEVLFGVALAWVGAGETPSVQVLTGGAIVLAALALNEMLAMRRASRAVPATDAHAGVADAGSPVDAIHAQGPISGPERPS